MEYRGSIKTFLQKITKFQQRKTNTIRLTIDILNTLKTKNRKYMNIIKIKSPMNIYSVILNMMIQKKKF